MLLVAAAHVAVVPFVIPIDVGAGWFGLIRAGIFAGQVIFWSWWIVVGPDRFVFRCGVFAATAVAMSYVAWFRTGTVEAFGYYCTPLVLVPLFTGETLLQFQKFPLSPSGWLRRLERNFKFGILNLLVVTTLVALGAMFCRTLDTQAAWFFAGFFALILATMPAWIAPQMSLSNELPWAYRVSTMIVLTLLTTLPLAIVQRTAATSYREHWTENALVSLCCTLIVIGSCLPLRIRQTLQAKP